MKLREIHKRIEPGNLNLCTGLLLRLTPRSRSDRFTIFQIAGGDGPETIARLYRTSTQEHLPIGFRYASNDHAWILIMHGMAHITDETGPIIPLRNPKIDLGAAIAAKIHVAINEYVIIP